MNIVLFTSSYTPRVGGLETAVSRLAREFERAGHRVTVVTNRYPRRLASFERVDGVAVHRILFPAPLVPRSAWGRTNMAAYVLLVPLAPWALLRLWLLLRRLRPHVVNIHYLSSPAFYVAILSFLRLLPARIVISCHGSDLTTVPYPTGSLGASRWIIARAQAVTACSADLARDVALMAPRLPGGAVRVVYNGTDVDELAGAVPFTHPRPYILSVGRLTEQKGMHVLVEALGLLQERGLDCDLIIAGSGPDAQRLRARAAALGLADHVHFEGSTGRARLGALYRGCAVFALAPVQEGFGIVSLEAMSCACAVVATRSGGIPEVVRDGETGLLARPGDPLDLADKLAALLTDPVRAADMGRRGRARVAGQFTWPVVAARYLDAYQPTTPRAPACTAHAARPGGAQADGVRPTVAACPAHTDTWLSSRQGALVVEDRACQNVQPPRPALSVLIATYNRAALLDRTLRSLLEGVIERPDDIVIINGGCDRTAEVVAHHIAAGAPIRLIQVVNVGLSASQNAGYPYCRGEIVATLDDDVIVAPDWVRRVKEAHAAYPQAGGIGGRTLNEFPDVLTARFEQARTFDVPGAGGVRPVRTVAGVNMSYKRAVMEEVGSFDESLPAGMDVDYNWRVARAGYPVLHDPSIVLTHHNRTSVGRMLRQQIWYGRGYFRTRRKWPDLPSSRIPRDVRGWRNWVKMVLFVVDPFVYHPLHYARRAATPGDSAAFAVLACCADVCMKAGFLREAVGAYSIRPRARQQGLPFRPVRQTPC